MNGIENSRDELYIYKHFEVRLGLVNHVRRDVMFPHELNVIFVRTKLLLRDLVSNLQ